MGNFCSSAAAGDVYDNVILCCPFFHEMPWMRSGTELSQFLKVFLPTLNHVRQSEINRYNQSYLIISRILKYQSFVMNIINLLGALYLISIKLFLILISKLVPMTPETVRTLNMFIRLRVILLPAIRKLFLIHGFDR